MDVINFKILVCIYVLFGEVIRNRISGFEAESEPEHDFLKFLIHLGQSYYLNFKHIWVWGSVCCSVSYP